MDNISVDVHTRSNDLKITDKTYTKKDGSFDFYTLRFDNVTVYMNIERMVEVRDMLANRIIEEMNNRLAALQNGVNELKTNL